MSRLLTTTIHISTTILTKSRHLPLSPSPPHFTTTFHRHLTKRTVSIRAVDSSSSSDTKNDDVLFENKEDTTELKSDLDSNNGSLRGDVNYYPSGEFEFEKPGAWKSFLVKLRMLIAYPWQRVRKGSVLTLKLRGQISDQVKTRFSSGLSLPQICENLIKAAYDPRISGVYLHIETLNCGWAKIEEIRRHILDFRKSGKFIIGYAPLWGEKEYYLGCACEELYAPPSVYFSLYGLSAQAQFLGGILEKVGVEPQVQRIGKYKSAGDQLTRKNISEENREVLNTLLDNIYGNWVDKISQAKGKKKEEIESFINEGVYQIDKLKEDGWITDIKYDDEYSKVKKWTVGLSGGKDKIAVIRASGSISRVRGPFSSPSSGIIAEQFIEKIRTVRESKRYKAVIIRIDSPGGDALASDLMWREIRLLAESKPVVASMVDVAATYDPRISAVYLEIETLDCGWGIIEEIRRHILDFRKSGKFIVGYSPAWGEKEYYIGCACEELYSPPSAYFSLYGLTAQANFYGGVFEKVGVEPLVQRIGKYKSAGDQLIRKNMSEENREAITTLLDNIYRNWVDKISQATGKKQEEIEHFINEGVYQIKKLKEDGWITDIKYDDEVTSMLRTKLGISREKPLQFVSYKKYSRVDKWTLGLSGGSDEIAVIRASGSISRVRGPFSLCNSGIIAEQFIQKIRDARGI
ncbi:hypothetical protein M8C21_009733 [Ambrosia artemisiifolia]|uniref:Peptidase S49 domain-containing protein n=1 Tax=Ambrosia artemisiifolia TaxID=4212 RepID=A0AAD5C6J0_AMBAR|nr:hypothetical protein M8C21_009733 [Ambrosia artemisiifolia]